MKKVLVIDDMPEVRHLLADVLHQGGYDVIGAGNGLAAIGLLKTDTPDLIVVDVDMPEINGITFLGALRCNPYFHDTPLIVLTGAEKNLNRPEYERFGVQAVLLKSNFHIDPFLCLVNQLLGEHALVDEKAAAMH